jgi:antitoxin HicB
MKPVYPARFSKEDEGVCFVQFIDIPEAMTDGETMEEAELNAREALSRELGFKLDNNLEIPVPSPHEGDDIRYIVPDARCRRLFLFGRNVAVSRSPSWPAPLTPPGLRRSGLRTPITGQP